MGDFDVLAFEDSSHQNGCKYWYAHELMDCLGYETWASFQNVITRAMAACAKIEVDPTEAFTPYNLIDEAGRSHKSYKLTRFAVFMVSQCADAKKPQVVKARAALAAIADALIEERVQRHDLGRVETRHDLREAERQMSGAAQDAGVQTNEFGLFKDAGFRGMYNMGLKQLCVRKGVDAKKTLYDFMGLEELAGNLFRVTQTAARLKSRDVRGLRPAMRTAESVGMEVRRIMIENSGVAPEALPAHEDVGSVKKRLKNVNKKMISHDGKAGTKKLPKPKP